MNCAIQQFSNHFTSHPIIQSPNPGGTMFERKLDGVRVAILATDYFEQSELLEPRKALEQAGAKTSVIAPKPGKIQGVKHTDKGETVKVDLTLDDADAEEFDAV